MGGTASRADARDLSLADLVELDLSYTTISDNFYRPVAPGVLLDGARTGIVAYLRGRGIDDPHVPLLRARADGRGVVPAIERQIALAIESYGSRVEPHDLIVAAIEGELGALHDPYSVLFTKNQLTRFTTALDGRSFGGVGLMLVRGSDDRYRVDAVIPASPAARAGIVAGDVLTAVDGIDVDHIAAGELAGRLRGRIGTVVRLRIERESAPRDFSLVRAPITPPQVTKQMLPGDVGYVSLTAFGPDAGGQVRGAVEALHAQGARATIFDLRGNGGGYEASAIDVASVFVPQGPIVTIQSRSGRRRTIVADGRVAPSGPLAVLVDHDSASGSELVAGAIADRGVGRVVGVATFGKGSVQTMFPLPDGAAMKLTTAHYLPPNARDINGVGIVPDIAVSEPADAVRGQAGRDPQLDAALAALSTSGDAPPATHR